MTNEKTKNIIIGILVVIIVILLVVISYIFGSKISNNTNVIQGENNISDNVGNVEQNVETDLTKSYVFGEEVILSNLLSVDMVVGVEDFSKWNVLSDNGDYVTLYSVNAFSKISNVSENTFASVLSQYQVDLGENGEIRALNETDLKLLGCDIELKKCNNLPDWAGYSLTEVTDGDDLLIFYGNADFVDDNTVLEVNDGALVYYRPVIKILKDNIK